MPAREEVLWRQKSRIVAKKEDKNTNLFIKWSMLVKKKLLDYNNEEWRNII